jgi:hypothetical protein
MFLGYWGRISQAFSAYTAEQMRLFAGQLHSCIQHRVESCGWFDVDDVYGKLSSLMDGSVLAVGTRIQDGSHAGFSQTRWLDSSDLVSLSKALYVDMQRKVANHGALCEQDVYDTLLRFQMRSASAGGDIIAA